MKRILLSVSCIGLLSLGSCSNNSTETATTDPAATNSETGTMDATTAAPAGSATTDTAMSSPAMDAAGAMAMANPNGPTAPHKDDAEFMKSAAHSDQNEIQLSQMALKKGVTGMAKTHAEMMVRDHTKSTADLKAIAQKKNVTLPTDMDAEHKAIAATMEKLSGKEFEKKFMDQMVVDHQKTLNTMVAHQQMTQDADLQGFITKTSPVVANHLDMSKKHAGMM